MKKPDFKQYYEINRRLWDRWTELHETSEFYDLPKFIKGDKKPSKIDLEEVGDVHRKSLLHLQCHFGMTTLAWANMGAEATGVDLSPKSIALARKLSQQTGIRAEFLESNIYDLPHKLDRQFDIVYTSFGINCWLPDLDEWARVAAKFVKPGGVFYYADYHPLAAMLDDDGKEFEFPYFYDPQPEIYETQGSYAAVDPKGKSKGIEWAHSLGEIITSIIKSGFSIEFFHEFPYSDSDCFGFLEEAEPGKYVVKGKRHSLPLMFSVKAFKK